MLVCRFRFRFFQNSLYVLIVMNAFAITGMCIFILYVIWNVRKVRGDSGLNELLVNIATCKSAHADKVIQQVRLYVLDYTRQKMHKLSRRRNKIRKLMRKVEEEDPAMHSYSIELHKQLLRYE